MDVFFWSVGGLRDIELKAEWEDACGVLERYGR